MSRIVISAINIIEGGPLTVLRDCLSAAAVVVPAEYEIIALVNNSDLIQQSRVRLIEIPSAKKTWLHRLYWEWFGFHRLSKELKPTLWLSLHDITPRVLASRQAVYCHNPSPFYRISLRESLQEPVFFLFNLLYIWLYRVFIRRNHYVIVQQQWLRAEFKKRFGEIPVVVAHPVARADYSPKVNPNGPVFIFLYPALPRVFKNLETLCRAAQLLTSRGVTGFEIRLTTDGRENRYARWLRKQFGATSHVRFIGRQTQDEMRSQYSQASAVVFPSKLETWGLPISEAKSKKIPLLVAELPYARETVGTYDLVSFFPADSPATLADLMQSMLEKSWQPTGNQLSAPPSPFAPDWASLWGMLIDGLTSSTSSQPPLSGVKDERISVDE
jgi:glycosyltransferase involved in cell wall biosynthesis